MLYMQQDINELVEQLKSIITEKIFESNWAKVECYHEVGTTILESGHSDQDLGQIANRLKVSRRTLQRSVQFATKFPTLEMLPEGKNTSWHKICNKYLPEPKELAPELPPFEFLKNLIIEQAQFMAETATAKKNGVEFFLPKDIWQ